MRTAVGSVDIPGDTVQKSARRGTDNVQVQVLAVSAYAFRTVPSDSSTRRASHHTSQDALPCSAWETVINSAGQVVGQMIGDGFGVDGISSGMVTVCVRVNLGISKCTRKYPVLVRSPSASVCP